MEESGEYPLSSKSLFYSTAFLSGQQQDYPVTFYSGCGSGVSDCSGSDSTKILNPKKLYILAKYQCFQLPLMNDLFTFF
jgi:hypothetical protein